jgi:hypothetical protein
MFVRIATVTTAVAAAIALGAGVSAAAPATAAPPPPLAGTSQTLTLVSGGVTSSATITFADSTWQLQGAGDSGSWVTTGLKVGLTTTGKTDHGCGYSGTYKAKTELYVGKFACQTTGPDGTFTLTTQGAAT